MLSAPAAGFLASVRQQLKLRKHPSRGKCLNNSKFDRKGHFRVKRIQSFTYYRFAQLRIFLIEMEHSLKLNSIKHMQVALDITIFISRKTTLFDQNISRY